MLNKKGALLPALALSVSLAFAGCSGGDAVTTPSSTEGTGMSSTAASGTITQEASSPDSAGTSAASGSKTDSGKTQTTKAVTAAETTAPPSGGKIDLDGYTFTWASGWMTLEDNMGEHTPLFERLFYERAAEVEKELNCEIKVIHFYARSSDLRTYIMAQKKIADVVESMPTWIPQNVAAGYLKDWNSVSGIDLEDSKWLSYASDVSTYKGKTYGISFLKPPEARYCIMFNKTLLEQNSVKASDLYAAVRNGTWTWNMLRDCAIKATKDTNGDNVPDTYGISGKYDYIANAILSSFGGSLVKESGGTYSMNLSSSASQDALNFYDQLVNTDKVVWVQDALLSPASYGSINEQSYVQNFNSGKSAFLFWESWVLNQYTKAAAKFDYGLLPLPKGGTATEYVSPAQNMRVLCLTSTNTDLDKTVPILNALAEPLEGYEDESAWWEDIQADYFQSDDKDSLDMYKMVLNSSMWDPGLAVESLEAAYYHDVVLNSIYWKNASVSSAVQSLGKSYDDAINSVYNK